MLEKYYKYRIKYRDCIIFIKYGSFYETFENDAFILNRIFDYKLTRLSNTFKSGFPTNKLSNITNRIESENINYIIVDNDNVIEFECENNKYNDFKFDDKIVNYNILKVDKIYKYLNNNLFDINLVSKLDRIEEIINE